MVGSLPDLSTGMWLPSSNILTSYIKALHASQAMFVYRRDPYEDDYNPGVALGPDLPTPMASTPGTIQTEFGEAFS